MNSGVESEKGAALVIVIFVILLLLGFVAIVLSRVNTETVLTANDVAENRTFAASEAQVESDSRDFVNLFSRKLSPPVSDINIIRNSTIAGFSDFDLSGKTITQTKNSTAYEITGGQYAGLYSLRDEWEIEVPAVDRASQVQTTLKRSFINDRIPLFQFGMFYEDDLELNRPPLFTFGGRVHTNSNLFISASPVNPSGGIYFNSKTTVVGEIVNDIWKMGTGLSAGTDDQNGVFFADTAGTYRELTTGGASVNCRNPSGANVFAAKPNLPNCNARTAWNSTDKLQFQGNLDNHRPRLDLPLFRLGVNLTELIKRGKNVGDVAKDSPNTVAAVSGATEDSAAISFERFANKQGLRVTLADAQNKLPGCSGVVANANFNECGIQLDRQTTGYLPKAMQDGYQATRLNTTRFAQNGKQMWIKVEIVDFDFDNGVPITKDVTEDFLSLGVTERAPVNGNFQISGYGASTLADSAAGKTDVRSIIKLQRFTIPGPQITNAAGTAYLSYDAAKLPNQNFVRRYTATLTNPSAGCSGSACGVAVANSFSAPLPRPSMNSGQEDAAHLKWAGFAVAGVYTDSIVPFPIEMFDTREGIAQDRPATNNGVIGTDYFGADNIPLAGVMSTVNIDVANLRKFLNGATGTGNSFNNLFPTNTPFAIAKGAGMSLNSADIPQNKGWVLYVSDRRGDADFDGEYDMEDTLPDGVMEFNEDVNGVNYTTDANGVKVFDVGDGTFNVLYYSSNNNFFEAPRYSDATTKSQGATADHGYYRRGVRLINGSILPGIYDRLSPTTTRGFTLASENGVYIQGNYNATSVTLSGTKAPAAATDYFPQGGTLTAPGSANATQHIPAAIVSDATTILSNAWNDAESFATPFAQESRLATATQIRFALLTGDTVTGKNGTTNVSPSATGGLGNGGVHNFKRFLEQWTGVRLNYTGALVNLFNSRNNNASFKCCEAVYNPPIRDWSFDTTFIDPNRLPPGTPYIYSTTLTGFERLDY
ncbi:MAG: hypothetical protein M3T96_10915 [Acidobacteriota bacterium]|nr:hypothetical protein [Acidobacteriota bacterium]